MNVSLATRRALLRTGLAVSALAAGLGAVPRAVRAALSATDRADLNRITLWFNDFETLAARFVQIAPNGSVATGGLLPFLARPQG